MPRRFPSLFATVLVGLVLLIGAGMAYVLSPHAVARLTLPDGTRIVVIQELSQFDGPFFTTFYYSRPGQPWFVHFFERDWPWTGRVEVDEARQEVLFTAAGRRPIRYHWPTGVYTDRDGVAWTAGKPKGPGWAPRGYDR